MKTSTDESYQSRVFGFALLGLVIFAFLTGGSAQISGWDDTVVQLLSLPILGWALWRISQQPASVPRNVALAVACLIPLIPVVQLFPIPEWLWLLPEARQQLAADLASVEAETASRWSLVPAATEQALMFLLPPLAAFAGVLAVNPNRHRRLLTIIMLLAMSSLLLAFLQLGVPAESLLNPFPRWAHQFNGIFANQNHQAISIVVGIVIALTALLASLKHVSENRRQAWTPWVLGFLGLFSLCALPLTASRGAMLIGVFAIGVVPLAMGRFSRRRLRESLPERISLAACIALVLVGAWGTFAWMQVDAVDELRAPLRAATLELGSRHAPLGAGVGAFVPAFEQGAPDALLLQNYVNHAHNDWAQWWMEAGWLGMAVSFLAIAVLAVASFRALRDSGQERMPTVAAMVGVVALLLHSWVDYPLRTVSLATVAAVLAGIVVSRGLTANGSVARSLKP